MWREVPSGVPRDAVKGLKRVGPDEMKTLREDKLEERTPKMDEEWLSQASG